MTMKYDAGKWRLSLIPVSCIRSIVSVLEFGAAKYKEDNWQTVPQARRRYYDAAIRHLTAWWDGERNDPESQLPHLAHAACCVIFLLWLDDNPQKPESPDNAEGN